MIRGECSVVLRHLSLKDGDSTLVDKFIFLNEKTRIRIEMYIFLWGFVDKHRLRQWLDAE